MLSDFKAYQMARAIHDRCKALSLPEFLYDQLFRASASVALNLAEGSGKRTPADQGRFYSNALGSLRECEAALDLAGIEDPSLRKLIDDLGAITFRLSNPIQKPKAGSKSP